MKLLLGILLSFCLSVLVFAVILALSIGYLVLKEDDKPMISPLAPVEAMLTPSATPTPTISPRKAHKGIASYYTRSGCVGCREDLLTANGDELDDAKLTVAFNRAPLNSMVRVKSVVTGKHIYAKVTDRGGFERLGRIIDLSLATKEAIGCSDLCRVEVQIGS